MPIESAQRCSLLELAQDKCRWPVSECEKADFAFCGNEAIAGFPCCAGHARMAYRSPARRRAQPERCTAVAQCRPQTRVKVSLTGIADQKDGGTKTKGK